MPVESKYFVIAAVVSFLVVLWLTHGSLMAGFGVLALCAGVGWVMSRIGSGR